MTITPASHDADLAFAPCTALARALLPHALHADAAADGAHDLAHLQRVWRNVQRIAAVEDDDGELLLAAVRQQRLHDFSEGLLEEIGLDQVPSSRA